ncbi:MAG TPA: YdeI/OmpD-associated family protein [Gemmatimonadaceae bacterium]
MAAKRGTEQNPAFFRSAEEYRAWLEKNHQTAKELWIGYWKKHTGKPSLTWKLVVDESLCFGWIDGIAKRIDADRYKQRVTPRRPTSIWSQVNIKRVAELTKEGRMRPAGIAAFEKRDRTKAYSFEQPRDRVGLGPDETAALQKNRKAWTFWQSQPPSYQRTAGWWVMSAKKEETRQRRLSILLRDSAAGYRIGPLGGSTNPEPQSKGGGRKTSSQKGGVNRK